MTRKLSDKELTTLVAETSQDIVSLLALKMQKANIVPMNGMLDSQISGIILATCLSGILAGSDEDFEDLLQFIRLQTDSFRRSPRRPHAIMSEQIN